MQKMERRDNIEEQIEVLRQKSELARTEHKKNIQVALERSKREK
jgi:hypothetical protein